MFVFGFGADLQALMVIGATVVLSLVFIVVLRRLR